MTLPLTPEMLVAGYEFLRTTPPFRRWKLPPSDEIEFHITLNPTKHGQYSYTGKDKVVIEISVNTVGHTVTLMESLGHEMVHLFQHRRGLAVNHGAEFQRCARLICKYHGFDPRRF